MASVAFVGSSTDAAPGRSKSFGAGGGGRRSTLSGGGTPGDKKMSVANPKQPSPSASMMALQKESKAKQRSGRKDGRARMRIPLPVGESYEKEFEYSPEGPARVMVRLERLMGSDRIRITDQKYMQNLYRQLETDEQKLWVRRSRQRKQLEQNRFRQLAIEGHMEPGSDMQDLYNHPVFRVNRILDRLARLDNEISILPTAPLPPITPVEPFEDYEKTGVLFAFHPGHYTRSASVVPISERTLDIETADELGPVPSTELVTSEAALESNRDFMRKYQKESGMITNDEEEDLGTFADDEEWGGEDYNEEVYAYPRQGESVSIFDDLMKSGGGGCCNADIVGTAPLAQAERYFGISAEEKMEKTFTPHRSALVDRVYSDDSGGANEIYQTAKDIMDTYKREQMKADSVVNKLHRGGR